MPSRTSRLACEPRRPLCTHYTEVNILHQAMAHPSIRKLGFVGSDNAMDLVIYLCTLYPLYKNNGFSSMSLCKEFVRLICRYPWAISRSECRGSAHKRRILHNSFPECSLNVPSMVQYSGECAGCSLPETAPHVSTSNANIRTRGGARKEEGDRRGVGPQAARVPRRHCEARAAGGRAPEGAQAGSEFRV
jgi:hypothetical protein